MNTSAFHNTLSDAVKVPIVDFNTFKVINKNSKKKIDVLISSIAHVQQCKDYMHVLFENNKKLDVYFNGDYIKYKRNGAIASKGGLSKEISIDRGHVLLLIEGNRIWMERFIAICWDIVHNKMPVSYHGWVANVMDGSGSVMTAAELGIPVNFHPDNIEWCLAYDNGYHGYMIRKLKNRTGHVYRFSALDKNLNQIFQMSNNTELKNYCIKHLIMVK